MTINNFYFEELGLANTIEAKLSWIGAIIEEYSLADIQEKIAEHSQGWNGDVGCGCQIMSRILFQL